MANDLYTFWLPEKAEKSIKKYRDVENNYLLFNRLVVSGEKNSYIPYAQKKEKSKKHNSFIKIVSNNVLAIAESLPFHKTYEFIPDNKLAVGIGCESPFSSIALITLHPVYGIPYIPGSAIKGVIRNCYIQKEFNGKEEEALRDGNFIKLFGNSADSDNLGNSKQKLLFFDAFPNEEFEISWDVQTPHFKDYYDREGKKQPLDTIEPNPIAFPVVKNTKFKIYICSYDKDCDLSLIENNNILKDAFGTYGIGAKTSLGYGIGKISPE
ncbi:MAG: type III-B CRISPR module RAMP protein Cmr6 [Clostridiales bacterium]|nr:type III-B CRISPR module RAMP protein Cmr6 [Clostridiales bacterium]